MKIQAKAMGGFARQWWADFVLAWVPTHVVVDNKG